jgi:quercetin dioxygenase-like cupin family protein
MSSVYRIDKWEKREKREDGEAPRSASLRIQMESEGYDVFEWSDRPGTVYGLHEHAEDQSHCIISGQLELTIEGEGVFILGPGDRDFMPAGTRHSARVAGDDPVVYLIGAKY